MRACVGAKGRELVSGVRGVKGVVEVRALPSSFNSRGSGEHREQAERLAALAVEKLGNLSLSFINLKSLKSRACALSTWELFLEGIFFGTIAFFWSRKRAELRKFASYAFHVFEIQCNERWCDSQGDEVNASRENSLTGSGAKQTQTMHPVVNVASRASITTIACDRTNYFVSTGCIIPSGIRVYTNNVSESVLVSFFSGQEWMTLSGDRFRWFNYSNKSLCTRVPKVVGKYGKGNGKGRIFKNFRNSFFLSFFFHLLSPFDGLLFLKRRNFRHRFRFIRGAVSRTGAKRNVEEDGEKVK